MLPPDAAAAVAAQLIARANAGFKNEHQLAASFRKHRAEIDALPLPLRKAVLLAYDQATIPEFSERGRR